MPGPYTFMSLLVLACILEREREWKHVRVGWEGEADTTREGKKKKEHGVGERGTEWREREGHHSHKQIAGEGGGKRRNRKGRGTMHTHAFAQMLLYMGMGACAQKGGGGVRLAAQPNGGSGVLSVSKSCWRGSVPWLLRGAIYADDDWCDVVSCFAAILRSQFLFVVCIFRFNCSHGWYWKWWWSSAWGQSPRVFWCWWCPCHLRSDRGQWGWGSCKQQMNYLVASWIWVCLCCVCHCVCMCITLCMLVQFRIAVFLASFIKRVKDCLCTDLYGREGGADNVQLV